MVVPVGGSAPVVAFPRRDQTADVERLGGHLEFVAAVRPGGMGPVCIDLDAKPVGVAQVQRFADGVVGRARSQSQTEHMCRKTAQRNSIRQEEGEVVQAEPATPRHRGNTGLLDKVHERRCASYAERSPTGATFEHLHAEHALVGTRPSARDR